MALTRLSEDSPDFKEFLETELAGLLPVKEFTSIQAILDSDPVLTSNRILSANDALIFIDALTNGITDDDGSLIEIEAIGLFVCNYQDTYQVFFDAKRKIDGAYLKDTGGGVPDPNPFPVH